MTRIAVLAVPALAALLVLSGCGREVKQIDSRSNQGVARVGEIDTQDWGAAAERMVNSLLAKGVVDAKDGKKKVLMVSTVSNDTKQHVDTDLLVKKIRVALNKSGKVLTTTAVRAGGAEDAASAQTRDLRQNDEFKQDTVAGRGEMIAPDYSLSGKILQVDAQAGKTQQSSFVFQLSLTNVRTGLAEWEEEVDITKQGKKPAVGW